jgi:hypothetical protein
MIFGRPLIRVMRVIFSHAATNATLPNPGQGLARMPPDQFGDLPDLTSEEINAPLRHAGGQGASLATLPVWPRRGRLIGADRQPRIPVPNWLFECGANYKA